MFLRTPLSLPNASIKTRNRRWFFFRNVAHNLIIRYLSFEKSIESSFFSAFFLRELSLKDSNKKSARKGKTLGKNDYNLRDRKTMNRQIITRTSKNLIFALIFRLSNVKRIRIKKGNLLTDRRENFSDYYYMH